MYCAWLDYSLIIRIYIMFIVKWNMRRWLSYVENDALMYCEGAPLGPVAESVRGLKTWSMMSCTVNGSALACAQGGIVLACSIFTNIVTPSYQQIASLQAEGRVCETQSYCVQTKTSERMFCLHGDQITSSGHTLCARMPRVITFTKRSHTFL